MLLRTIALAVAFTAIASQAQACAYLSFRPFVADGRVRGGDGQWRRVWLQGDGEHLRIEYDSPKTPWGRVAVVGDVRSGTSSVFPVSAHNTIPADARVVWPTSWAKALPEVGLNTDLFDWWDTWAGMGGTVRVNGIACAHPLLSEARYGAGAVPDPKICLAEGNVPVLLTDKSGRRIYEATTLRYVKVDPDRFIDPPQYPISLTKPEYLKNWGC